MKSSNIRKLNYQMIFEENDPQKDGKNTEEKLYETEELLEKKESIWQKNLEKACEEAYQKGIKEGEKDGYKRASAEVDDKINTLEKAFEDAHNQWLNNREEIVSHLISTAFDITEAIIGVKPKQGSNVEEKLKSELNELMQKLDQECKTDLYVSADDMSIIQNLLNHYENELSVKVHVLDSCEQGEFIVENSKMKVVKKFKNLLSDFKESLSIPDWS